MALLWKPTLAATLPTAYDLTTLPYPLLASPKIDGVRAMVQGGVVVSRNGRPIPNRGVQKKFGSGTFEGFDGELTIGPPYAADVFNRTVSVVMSGSQEKEEAALRLCRFNVFDFNRKAKDERAVGIDLCGRLSFLAGLKSNGVDVVTQTRVNNAAALLKFEERCRARGYEGVMLRRLDAGAYMGKRSTLKEFYLVKLKRFDYGFGVVKMTHPLQHNKNEERVQSGRRSSKKAGMVVDMTKVGSVTVRDSKTGIEFDVKVPTDRLQSWPGWERGDWQKVTVRYKYQLVGAMNGVPRFPTCDFKELL